MQINREMLAQIASMDDSRLWQKIRAIAENYGYTLSENQPPHAELEKIRSLLRGDVQIGPKDAMRLVNQYKKRGQN